MINHPTYSAPAMRASLDMRANIAARGPAINQIATKCGSADEQRLRQTEQMLVLAAHGRYITASSEMVREMMGRIVRKVRE